MRQGFRQKARIAIQFVFFLSFPVTIFWFSPYVIIDGAMRGIVTGAFLLFCALFVSSLLFGRLFCSWICPAGFIQDTVARSRTKPYNGRVKNALKWLIWFPWIAAIAFSFARAGGIESVQALYMMESGISVDEEGKYIVYFGIVLIFFGMSFLGKRAACHTVCWMAPFMILGTRLSKVLRLPRLRLEARSESCSGCGKCVANCPMSLDVKSFVEAGEADHAECVHCGQCVDGCAKGALRFAFRRKR